MPLDERERSFENALARHLRPAGSSGACFDAETLAAYHEQSLAPDQMAPLKAHVSDCARCQEILLQLQATDEIPLPTTSSAPPPPAAAKPGVHVLSVRKPRVWRWVAPAGALAAALLVWVAVHENHAVRFAKAPSSGERKPTEIAKAQPSSTPPLPPPSLDATANSERLSAHAISRPDVGGPSVSKIFPSPQRHLQSLKKDGEFESARKPASAAKGNASGFADAAPKSVTPSAPQPVSPQFPGAVTETVTVEPANPEAAPSQVARDDLAKTEPKAKSEDDKRDVANSRTAPLQPAIAGVAPQPAPTAPPPQTSQTVEVTAESVQLSTESAEVRNLPAQGRQSANLTKLNEATQLLLASSTGPVTVSAPGGRASWRIGHAGIILFSSDAGKSWLVQPSGIITDLLAGSAPSAKVCWIVGRSGTILRTTDNGKHWRQVQPPTRDDFVSVFAVNARQATVSPAQGTYQTTDGGATWKKLPPQ